MKRTNNHNTVMYRYPPGITVRRRRRGYRVSLDDRSSQYQAMMAHVRATGYRNQNTQGDPVSASNSRSTAESLVELSQRYDTQASRTFIRDAAVLAATAAISGWAFIHTLQAIAAS
jgi:hypothetical protein